MGDDNPTGDLASRAAIARETCPFLTTKQAAYYLGLAHITMRRMRAAGIGPKCRMHTRAWRYHIDDLDAWSAHRARGGDDA